MRLLYGSPVTPVSPGDRVLVVGDGVIGLTITVQLAARGIGVAHLAPGFPGAASPASAGMLAQSVERTQGAGQAFSDASPDAWRRLRDLVFAEAGVAIPVTTDGLLRVATSDRGADELRATLSAGDSWLSADAARRLVPTLGAVTGAAHYAHNGWVDAPSAIEALRAFARRSPRVTTYATALAQLDARGLSATARLADGTVLDVRDVVLAAGAWSPATLGVARRIPIAPLRGALLIVDGQLSRLPVYAAEGHAYVLPRGDSTVVGATSDAAGFDASPRRDDADRLVAEAARLFPRLGSLPQRGVLVGLRPMTADGLPVIGRDPAQPRVVYACGHGRNGFLQAALTAEVVADIIVGTTPIPSIAPFSPSRFDLA